MWCRVASSSTPIFCCIDSGPGCTLQCPQYVTSTNNAAACAIPDARNTVGANERYIYLSAYALPELAKSGGRIIAVGSAAGKQGLPRVAPYAASKHAIFGYFDSLRQDLVASPDPALARISVSGCDCC